MAWNAEEVLKRLNMTEWNAEEYLKKLYDKQLMNIKTESYSRLFDGNFHPLSVADNWVYDVSEDKRGWLITKEQLMAELSTRGNVPTAKENKEIRQQRAKKKF